MHDREIRLLPQTPRHWQALLEGPECYEERFGIQIARGIRDFLVGPEVSAEFLRRLQQEDAVADPWKDGFGVWHIGENKVIGLCSFVEAPTEDGMVEIAYGIAPEYQRRGHATKAARGLIDYAIESGRVRLIRAHTLPQYSASTAVLFKCGFALVGEVFLSQDGEVWRWEKEGKAAEGKAFPTQ